jgi:hypothetical protein
MGEDPVAQDLPGRSGAQFVAVVDPAAAGQRRGDQRHRLVAGVGPPGRVAEIDAFVDQFPQPQPDRERGGQQQPGVSDQALIVESDLDMVRVVRSHRTGALLIRSRWTRQQRHSRRSAGTC